MTGTVAPLSVDVPVEVAVIVTVPETVPVMVFVVTPAVDSELCSDANAELKTVKALVVLAAVADVGDESVAEDAPTTTTPVAVLVLVPVRDSRAELRTVKALVVPLVVTVLVEPTALTVATGTTTLMPVVVSDTLPVFAERTEFALVSIDDSAEAALLSPDDTAAPGADSVTVIVATIEAWPVQTGRVTLVI
jgi:hypothetical protein